MRCTARLPSLRFCDNPIPDASPISLCRPHLEVAADWLAQLKSQPTKSISKACPSCGATELRVATDTMTATCGACGVRWRPDPRQYLREARDAGVIYYLRFADRIKIGTTTNLKRRLAGLPHDELLATEPGGPQVERQRHEQFADARVPGLGEWFYRSAALLEHIEMLTAGQAQQV